MGNNRLLSPGKLSLGWLGLLLFSVSIDNLSLSAFATTHCIDPFRKLVQTAQISPELIPKKGPPVLIGVLVETPEGKPLLITTQQISEGHASLLSYARKVTGTDTRKILWAGELLIGKQQGRLQIVAANETAGLLYRSPSEMGFMFELDRSNARVENLISFLNQPEHRALRSLTMKAEKFHADRPPSHFDPDAQGFSDFRHSSQIGTDMALMIRRLSKLGDAAQAQGGEYLKTIAERVESAIHIISEIEAQRGLRFPEITQAPELARIRRHQVLTKEEYTAVLNRLESFFRNYRAPIQAF